MGHSLPPQRMPLAQLTPGRTCSLSRSLLSAISKEMLHREGEG